MNIRPEGRELARRLSCGLVEASTNNGYGVEDAFDALVREIRTSNSSELGYFACYAMTDC